MNQSSHAIADAAKGQYILTAENQEAPKGWITTTFQNWKLYTFHLPVIDVYNEEEKWIGWCLGHPIVDNVLHPEKIVLSESEDSYDPYERFYERSTGKWLLILVGLSQPVLYLDPYGSLPAVYATNEATIAATPTLIGSDADWDEQLLKEIGYPEKIDWLPSGLTSKRNVRRLMANHYLRLSDFTYTRHWPRPDADFSIDHDTNSIVARIVANMQGTVNAVAEKFPICLTITAGMDSRMVLAASRQQVQRAKVITFAKEPETVDMFVARRLAQQVGLDHSFLPVLHADEKEMERWQLITGRSVSGDIWHIHKTLFQLDQNRVLMTGQSGEVHRGNYWRPGDTADMQLTASELLKRCKFPPDHPRLLEATEAWLAELSHFSKFTLLDLVHIEQRMSCWGALQSFGNTTSLFEIAPLSSRLIFQGMMRLPHDYRKKQQLPADICNHAWAELLKLPFNTYPGLRGVIHQRIKKMKKMVKRIVVPG